MTRKGRGAAHDGPASPSYHDRTVRAIRRIIRAVDLFSRKLQGVRGVTVPQLSCLLHVVKTGQLTLTALAHAAELSASTAVGIVDRLEQKGLVTRVRSDVDRRQVIISPTPTGIALIKEAPSPLQDRLASALDELPELEQAAITLSLERIVDLMGIEEVEASPILDTGVSLTADDDEEGEALPVNVKRSKSARSEPPTQAAGRIPPHA